LASIRALPPLQDSGYSSTPLIATERFLQLGDFSMVGLLVRASAAAFFLALTLSSGASARDLKLSHQWPESDARHKASRVLMAELRKRGTDLSISIHPNSSLKFKPVEQYDALLEGKIELAVYPIAYQSAKVPEFSIGLLPGVPSNAETASLLKGTPFESKLQKICEEKGFRILTWWWVGGAVASRAQEIAGPDSVKGLRARRWRPRIRRHAGCGRRQRAEHALERDPRGDGSRQARCGAHLLRVLHELPRHQAGQVRHAGRQRHLGDVHARSSSRRPSGTA
jgi:hypothetical protein